MECLVGVGLALGVAAFATLAGYDRERAFYPILLAAIASYYDLFAIMGGREGVLGPETAGLAVFAVLSVIGFRTNLWIVVFALMGHGLFDFVHGRLITNPGVPDWWPMFCLSFDGMAATCLGWRLLARKTEAWDRHSFGRRIRPYVEAKVLAADTTESDHDAAVSFARLERAHVLSPASTVEHVSVHVRMPSWGARHRRAREIIGQILRIGGAAAKTPFALVPHGNTGCSDVSRFRSTPIARDLVDAIAAARVSVGGAVSIMLVAAAFFGTGACSTVAISAPVEPIASTLPNTSKQQIAYRVLGTGKPVIVLISGLGDGMATFKDVASDLAQSATVITYDRSGYGASEAVSGPKDAKAAEAELTSVLSRSGVVGPYVLVGHSLGGLFAEYYAARHPDQIAALVLEESRPAPFSRVCEAAGIAMCTPTPAMVTSAPAGVRAEVEGLLDTMSEVEAAGAVGGKPVLVLSRPIAANAKPMDALWATAQQDLAARYPGSQHLVAPGGAHYIHLNQRAWFVSVIEGFLSSGR
jgi:pimeloyl-ACP methyl ester carboxylesterase